MCQHSQRHGNFVDAQRDMELVLRPTGFGSKAFYTQKDGSEISACIREGCWLGFTGATPRLQELSGVASAELRAAYEDPDAYPRSASEGDTDGLRFYHSDGEPAKFVRFSDMVPGERAKVLCTADDGVLDWPIAASATEEATEVTVRH